MVDFGRKTARLQIDVGHTCYTYTNIISETHNTTCSAIRLFVLRPHLFMLIWVPFQFQSKATIEIITNINNVEKVHYIYMIPHLS